MLFFEDEKQKKYNKLAERFHEILIDPDLKEKIGVDYLQNRKISKQSIDKFKIGYCPENIKLSGLLQHMSGRIIFPIFNEYNDVVAFSGRIPKDRQYIKKGESVWFHESFAKPFFPYGLNIAWPHIVFRNQVILVEGQCDVISMHEAGYFNTVGLTGGSFTGETFVKLARFTNTFITMFDGDMAGRASANRAKEILTEYKSSGYTHHNVSLIFKEDGKNKEYDPDEFILKYGRNYMKKVIDRSISLNSENDEIKDILS